MANETVQAVFASERAASEAKAALTARGVPAGRMAISASVTADALAGEAPGESYENQGSMSERRTSRFDEAVRAGTCVLSVKACSPGEERELEELMRRYGARAIMQRP